jgi:hypothetical protein
LSLASLLVGTRSVMASASWVLLASTTASPVVLATIAAISSHLQAAAAPPAVEQRCWRSVTSQQTGMPVMLPPPLTMLWRP